MLKEIVSENGVRFSAAQFLALLSVQGEGRSLIDRLGLGSENLTADMDRPSDFDGQVLEWAPGVPGWVRAEGEALAAAVSGASGTFVFTANVEPFPALVIFRSGSKYGVFFVGPVNVVAVHCSTDQAARIVADYSTGAGQSDGDWNITWHSGGTSRAIRRVNGVLGAAATSLLKPPDNVEELFAQLLG